MRQGACRHCPRAWELEQEGAEGMEASSFLFLEIVVGVSKSPAVGVSHAEERQWPSRG